MGQCTHYNTQNYSSMTSAGAGAAGAEAKNLFDAMVETREKIDKYKLETMELQRKFIAASSTTESYRSRDQLQIDADRAPGLRVLKDVLEEQIKIFVHTTGIKDNVLDKPAYGTVRHFMQRRLENITWEKFLERINSKIYSSTLKSN